MKNVIENYCQHFSLVKTHAIDSEPTDDHTISDFISNIDRIKANDFGASNIYNNHQRTSTRSGITKAEAVYKAANILLDCNINTIIDILRVDDVSEIELKFRTVPGQSSGISFAYFMMLCGKEDYIKIDRKVTKFVNRATGITYSNPVDIRKDLEVVYECFKKKHPSLTLRKFDYSIWKYMNDKCNCHSKTVK